MPSQPLTLFTTGPLNLSFAKAVVLTLVLTVAAAGCGGQDDGDDQASATTQESVVDTTTTTEATTPEADDTSTTDTTAADNQDLVDQQIEISQRMMEPIVGFRESWLDCIAAPAECDFDATVSSYLVGAADDTFRQSLEQRITDSTAVRDTDGDSVYFVTYQLVTLEPLVGAVQVCSDDNAVLYEINGDGTETVLDDDRIQQFILYGVEEQPDGHLAIKEFQNLGDTQPLPEGTCEPYYEQPS